MEKITYNELLKFKHYSHIVKRLHSDEHNNLMISFNNDNLYRYCIVRNKTIDLKYLFEDIVGYTSSYNMELIIISTIIDEGDKVVPITFDNYYDNTQITYGYLSSVTLLKLSMNVDHKQYNRLKISYPSLLEQINEYIDTPNNIRDK